MATRRGLRTDGTVTDREVSSQEDLAEQASDQARANRALALQARLADIPVAVNSIPALRDEVNNIKEFLREIYGVEV